MNSALLQITETPANVKLIARMITIDKETVVIGNSIESDLVLMDDTSDPNQQFVSITPNLINQQYVFKALTNTITVNGVELIELAPVSLNDGDIIHINGYTLIFSWQGEVINEPESTAEIDQPNLEKLLTEKDDVDFDVNNILLDRDENFEQLSDNETERSSAAPEIEYQSASFFGTEQEAHAQQLDNIEKKLDRLIESNHNPWLQQKELFLVLDNVVKKFVHEFSPQYIEDIIGKPSVLSGKHWQVYQKFFAEKQDSGQFPRQFKALLIECLQEKQ